MAYFYRGAAHYYCHYLNRYVASRLDVIYKKVCKNDLLQIDMGISGFPILRLRIPSWDFTRKRRINYWVFPLSCSWGGRLPYGKVLFPGSAIRTPGSCEQFFPARQAVFSLKVSRSPQNIKAISKNVTCNRLVWATKSVR